MKKTFAVGAAAATLALLAGLVGCSGGGASAAPETVPSVSTQPEEASAPSITNFANSVEFTRLVQIDQYTKAATMVVKGSAAERYLAHQVKYGQALKLDGQNTSTDPNSVTVDGDETTGEIRVERQSTGAEPQVYTWKDFQFAKDGKIKSWTGKSGEISKVLWTRESKVDGDFADGRLVSAYQANSGELVVVVEWKAGKRDVTLGMPTYTVKGGYAQEATSSGPGEVGKSGKILTYYSFADSKIGGKMTLDSWPVNGYGDGDKMTLTVR